MLTVTDELFEHVWPFCGVGAERVKGCKEIQDACGKISNIGWDVMGASLNFLTTKFGKSLHKVHILPAPHWVVPYSDQYIVEVASLVITMAHTNRTVY